MRISFPSPSSVFVRIIATKNYFGDVVVVKNLICIMQFCNTSLSECDKFWLQPIGINANTIFAKKIFTHVLTNISAYIGLIFKKSVTKLKPFKFGSHPRKPHLSNSMCSKVNRLWMKYFILLLPFLYNLQTILFHYLLNYFKMHWDRQMRFA